MNTSSLVPRRQKKFPFSLGEQLCEKQAQIEEKTINKAVSFFMTANMKEKAPKMVESYHKNAQLKYSTQIYLLIKLVFIIKASLPTKFPVDI